MTTDVELEAGVQLGHDLTAELPKIEVTGRRGLVVDRFEELELDALVLTGASDIRWLTGFTGSSATVVLTSIGGVLITDGRYGEQAASEADLVASDLEIIVASDRPTQLARVAEAAGAGFVGGVPAELTWSAQLELDEALERSLVPVASPVAELREVKDAAEIARMARAAAITDLALAECAHLLIDRCTETEFALALEVEMRTAGAGGVGYPLIVASGPNGARPHARPEPRPMQLGDLVVLDIGAEVDGYRSDMTRTLAIGNPPEELVEVFELVTSAQAAATAMVAAGMTAAEIDAASRGPITGAGYGDRFVHPSGHSLGLDIHEPMRLSASSTDVLEAGNVVTVEPGVYLEGLGGCRVEDTMLVLAGGAVPLTRSPKDLTWQG